MEWLQAFMVAGSTIGACWMMHRENKELTKEFRGEIKKISDEIAKESKDFHGRLCQLEEKYTHMMQRFMEKR
jgi:hypothetical protein